MGWWHFWWHFGFQFGAQRCAMALKARRSGKCGKPDFMLVFLACAAECLSVRDWLETI
jgi:hypothetical protein